jgi:hypothetical protein
MNMGERLGRLAIKISRIVAAACSAMALAAQTAGAQDIKIIKTDTNIDALDPGSGYSCGKKCRRGTHVHERKRRYLPAWCDRPVYLRLRSRSQGLFVGRLDGEARLCRLDGRLPQLRLFDARESHWTNQLRKISR